METQKNTLADLLLVEVHRGWSRQTITVGDQAGGAVPFATVLGKVTATGLYVPLAPAAQDGSAAAAAVLIDDLPAVADDMPAAALCRGAVVNTDALVWPAGIAAGQKAAAIAALEALGIVAKAVL